MHVTNSSKHASTSISLEAFTLIEILISITVIAILAGIILTSYSKTISHTRTIRCATNLRQIGIAIQLYTTDHNGSLPPSVKDPDTTETTTPVKPYYELLLPYITMQDNSNEKSDIFVCPETDHYAGACYGVNERLSDPSNTTAPGVLSRQAWGKNVQAVNLNQIINPAKTFLAVDAFQSGDLRHGTWLSNAFLLDRNISYFGGELPQQGIAPRHGSGEVDSFNVLFCDGHVESISWTDPRLNDASYLRSFARPR